MRRYFGTNAIVTNLNLPKIDWRGMLQRRSGSDPQFIRISWLLVRVDDGLNQRWLWRTQRRLDRRQHLLGTLTAIPLGAACAREGDEVDRREIAAERRIAKLHLLELDLSEAVVLEDDDLDREIVCTAVVISAISIANPPSPTIATDCRSGYASWPAMANGRPGAIEAIMPVPLRT